MSTVASRVHGGPDELGLPRWDFSSNGNACGPCPMALRALRRADPMHYPDPAYRVLRERLADFHGVAVWRIVPAASASEFIFRITALAARSGLRHVRLPRHGYGDYRHAAQAWGLALSERDDEGPALAWACEPSSPEGLADPAFATPRSTGTIRVLDRAYEPLRLHGAPSLGAAALDDVWQLFSPNKALGLTGVRAAYAIAPSYGEAEAAQLEQLACSWPLGAHGVALLQVWCEALVQQWLQGSREQLRTWRSAQLQLLQSLRWHVQPGLANFMLARPQQPVPALLAHLRAQGLKLRDCTSFGLPGALRLSVQPPPAQAALRRACQAYDPPANGL